MHSRLPRWAALSGAVAMSLATAMPQGAAAQSALPGQATCAISSGFYPLTGRIFLDQATNLVGDCTQSPYLDQATSNVLQPTTGGLLYLRSCDNTTAFTDGTRTWLLGPNDLQSRLNTDTPFDWECTPAAAGGSPSAVATASLVVPPPAPAAAPTPAPQPQVPAAVACPDKIVSVRNLDFSYQNHPQGQNWRCADAYHVKLVGADLSGVDLEQANLSTADVSHATFAGAHLARANLVSLAADGSQTKPGPVFTSADLRGAKMSASGMTQADFRYADMSNADLSRTNFKWADLRGADLRGADLSQANFTNANLTGAYLCGANTAGATFKDAVGVSTSCG